MGYVLDDALEVFWGIVEKARENSSLGSSINLSSHPLNLLSSEINLLSGYIDGIGYVNMRSNPLRMLSHPLNSLYASSEDRAKEISRIVGILVERYLK